ncbi:hypothetical protein [Xanthobacter aminoxidans]|uniref:hypothetical protein n=1 Tax=Xanthobacter aminoxidans TaxID=186280 RepID=UPI00372C8599
MEYLPRHEPIKRAEVFERTDDPGVWSVEAIGTDGEIYQSFFVGPDAEQRARDYATLAYGVQ